MERGKGRAGQGERQAEEEREEREERNTRGNLERGTPGFSPSSW